MSYTISRQYKFDTAHLDLSRDLPLFIALLETLFAKHELDVRDGELPSLDFLNRSLNDMNEYVGEVLEEYERMIARKEENFGRYVTPAYYENHYGSHR